MPGVAKLGVAALVFAAGSFAQAPAARPAFDAFEAATIKPTAPDSQGGRFITMQSAHWFSVKNYTVRGLVMAAYNLPARAVSGGPAWVDTEHYDIAAATPNEVRPSVEEQMSMLRKLVAERFALTSHREQKELPIYVLTVAKTGLKLQDSTAAQDANPALINRVYPGRIVLPARNATMAQFASMMQRAVVDRPIVDRTGLSGRYDFELEWTPDETQFSGQIPAGPADAPVKPDLFAALQQQLGLKLEATKGPVQVMVIDQVKRPSAN